MNSNKFSLIIGGIALIGFIISGFLGETTASIISLSLMLLIWMVWVTQSILKFNLDTVKNRPQTHTILRIPYPVERSYANNEPLLVNSNETKMLIQSDFLSWSKFTILFWVNITEEFLKSKNNRYIFAYHSESIQPGNYRDAFYLGLKKSNLQEKEMDWRFVIGGRDYNFQTIIPFQSNQTLLGWKLFSITWSSVDRELKLNIDASNVFVKSESIQKKGWPNGDNSKFLSFGGWVDWEGGLSFLKFYKIRFYKNRLSNGEVQEIYKNELKIIQNLIKSQNIDTSY